MNKIFKKNFDNFGVTYLWCQFVKSIVSWEMSFKMFYGNTQHVYTRSIFYRWRGKYGSSTGFFPARCVVELEAVDTQAGDLSSYGTIELVNSLIEEVPPDVAGRPFAFKIKQACAHWNPSVSRGHFFHSHS